MVSDTARKISRVVKDMVPERVKLGRWRRLLEQESTLELGFHQDHKLLELASHFLSQSTRFVETGAFAGATTCWVARNFPDVAVHSCEPLELARHYALRNTAGLSNVEIHAQPSPKFLYDLFEANPSMSRELNTFWLDAHGYGFPWPLREEIAFITKETAQAFVMIDDFKVPGRPDFGYDIWEGDVCDYSYIEHLLAPREPYHLVYPAYGAADAATDDLRGVVTVVVAQPDFDLPPELAGDFSIVTVGGHST